MIEQERSVVSVGRFLGLNAAVSMAILATLLGACSGGGGEDGDVGGMGDPDGTPDPSAPTLDDPAATLLPNLVITDIIASPTTDPAGLLTVSVVIANAGEGATSEHLTNKAWFLVSGSADLSNGYHVNRVALTAAETSDGVLDPGETETFIISGDRRDSIPLELTRSGSLYGRLWLNPDLSTVFENEETTVVPEHAFAESNYDDNLSAIVPFEHVPAESLRGSYVCEPDALEENDTLATAEPIALDTTYVINPCDDSLDVFVVDLAAGQAVELAMNPLGPSYWTRVVIDPNGRYLERGFNDSDIIVRAEIPGPYRFAFVHRWNWVDQQGARESTFVIETLR